MRIVEIDSKKDGSKVEIISTTYDEELDLADSVLAALGSRWLPDGYRKIATEIFQRRAYGRSVTVELFQAFLEKVFFWNDKLREAHGHENEFLIPYPGIEINDETMIAPHSTRTDKMNYDERARWYKREIIRAWKEMYEKYRRDLSAISDDLSFFPGDKTTARKRSEEARAKFHKAVKASQKRFGISYGQAVKEVADRMPQTFSDGLRDFSDDT